MLGTIRIYILQDHFSKTDNACQDIVEIMSYTACKGAQSFQLLDPDEMFLRLLALICLFLEGFVSLAQLIRSFLNTLLKLGFGFLKVLFGYASVRLCPG